MPKGPFNAGDYRSGRGVAIPATGVPQDHERYPHRGGLPPRPYRSGASGQPSAALNVMASKIMQDPPLPGEDAPNVIDGEEEEFNPSEDPELSEPTYMFDISKIDGYWSGKQENIQLLRDLIQEMSREDDLNESAVNVALDIAGLIPGIGEVADATNAVLHAKKGEYLMSALSLISIIPTIGDAVGKGGKISLALKKAGPEIVKIKSLIRANRELIQKVLDKAEDNEKLKDHAENIKKALNAFAGEDVQESLRMEIRKAILDVLGEDDDSEEDLLLGDEAEDADLEEFSAMGGGAVQGWTGPMTAPSRKQVKRMEKASSSFGGGQPAYKKKSRRRSKKR